MRRAAIERTLLITVVMCGGCGQASERGTRADSSRVAQSTGPLPKLRVSLQEHLSQAPLMIADAEGFFHAEGLDIEFVPAMRSQESLVALITGDIDVRPGPISAALLSAIAQKAPIRAVADEGFLAKDGCAYYGIVLRNGLDTAGSPQIKRMRAGSDGMTRYLAERLLAMNNISIAGIETVSLPEVVMAGSLESGGIDAIATTEPTLTRLAKYGQRWLSGQHGAPGMQWGVISFSERLLTTDRELGVRFLRAYRRGVAQFREGKTPRNVAIIAKGTAESEETIRGSCWLSFREDSRISWESIETFQAWALANKMMDQTVTQSQVWDSSFLLASDSARK